MLVCCITMVSDVHKRMICSTESRTARIRRRRERESTGGEIPWGEVLVISEVGYDFLQRLVLGDVHIEALFTLVVPFINHLGSH